MSVNRVKRADGTFASAFYYYDFQYRGTRFRGSTACTDKRDAQRFEKELKKKLKSEQGREELLKPSAMLLSEACSLYWEQVGQHAATSNDIWTYLRNIKRLLGADLAVDKIGSPEIADAISRRRASTAGPKKKPHLVTAATVNRTFTEPLRRILRRAKGVWKQPVQDIIWKDLLLPEPQERIKEASDAEETTINTSIRDDYLPALQFKTVSACRLEEVVGLMWPNVLWTAGVIRIEGKGRRGADVQVRLIPITDAIRDILWPLRHDHKEHVFTYRAAKRDPKRGIAKGDIVPITYEGLKTRWRRDVREKLDDFRMHDLRHTALTRLVRKTGNLKLAQTLAGHKDINTTSRYAHATIEDLRNAMNATTPRKIPQTEDVEIGQIPEKKSV